MSLVAKTHGDGGGPSSYDCLIQKRDPSMRTVGKINESKIIEEILYTNIRYRSHKKKPIPHWCRRRSALTLLSQGTAVNCV